MKLRHFFLNEEESPAAKALKIGVPETGKEYTEEEVSSNLKKIIAALKDYQQKDKLSKLEKASRDDLISCLRKWIKLYDERFESSDIVKTAKSYLPGKAPEKITAPVDIAAPMDPKLAAKSGVLAPDPEVIKMLDKDDEESQDDEEDSEKEEDKKKKNKK